MLFLQIIRQFFYSIDSVLYNFIPIMYDLIITIARTSILSQAQIKEFSDRIQILLGVFMLFKVSISLITYIVNPDDFSDKSKGFGKLWLNVIISLSLLICTPYIFSLAFDFQVRLLEDNTLVELVMGTSEENVGYIYTAGDEIAFKTMLPFFTPNSSIKSLQSCANLLDDKHEINSECSNAMLEIVGSKKEVMIKNYTTGINYESFGMMFRVDIAKHTIKKGGSEYFLIDYKLGISTVAAVIVLLILTTFCMDVALRSVKLAFLQLIAPIPIISYIDPKSGKDGMFKKWYEMCFKTYLSLFIRLVSLYFGVYIIASVTGMYDAVTGESVTSFVIQLFIIIGVLMFIKQLPKILEGLGLKIDGDGKFNLNPLKKFEEEAFGGKQIIGAAKGLGATALAAGAAGGTNALNTVNRVRSSLANKEGARGVAKALGSGLLSTLAGTASGATRGLHGTAKGKKFGEVFSNSYSGAMQAREKREARKADGVSWYETIIPNIQKTVGISTKADAVKKVEEKLKTYQSTYESIKSVVTSSDDDGKSLSKQIEAMQKTSINPNDYVERDPTTGAVTGFNDTAYNDAVNRHNQAIKTLEDQLESRINAIAAGANVIRGGVVQTGANEAIKENIALMDKLRDSINSTARAIDPDFTEISGPDITAQYKSSKGSQSQFAAAHEAIKAKDVDTHAKGVGPIASGKK